MNAQVKKRLIDIVGWVGTVLLLTGFFLNTFSYIDAESGLYLLFNLLGSAGVGLNALYYRTYPSVAVEGVWFLIALLAIGRMVVG